MNRLTIDKLPTFADSIETLRASEPELAQQFADYHGIEQVLVWMHDHQLSQHPVDMVAMDEFEYDFILEWLEGKWIVFGVT